APVTWLVSVTWPGRFARDMQLFAMAKQPAARVMPRANVVVAEPVWDRLPTATPFENVVVAAVENVLVSPRSVEEALVPADGQELRQSDPMQSQVPESA